MQRKVDVPYPDPLRDAIIARNFPILRNTQSSYLNQIARAIDRRDSTTVHHRITSLLASYFDVLFAVNRVPHPGEKRLIQFAETNCNKLPAQMRADVESLLHAGWLEKVRFANTLINGLEKLLRSETVES
ncbi:DUF4037 domain-containing protein [bacterium]|nr:DUF4037 domain-containing protein [bacterium]